MTKNSKQIKKFSGEIEVTVEIKKVNELIEKALENLTELERFYHKNEDLESISNFFKLLDGCSEILEEMQKRHGVNSLNYKDLKSYFDNINESPVYKGFKGIESMPMNDFGYTLLDASKSVIKSVEKLDNLLSIMIDNPSLIKTLKLINFWEKEESKHSQNQEKLSKKVKKSVGTKLSKDNDRTLR